jgi:hypothetical protein
MFAMKVDMLPQTIPSPSDQFGDTKVRFIAPVLTDTEETKISQSRPKAKNHSLYFIF